LKRLSISILTLSLLITTSSISAFGADKGKEPVIKTVPSMTKSTDTPVPTDAKVFAEKHSSAEYEKAKARGRGLSKGAKIGIGVGVAVAVVVIILAVQLRDPFD
jgi:hypothetical protein